jgi:hypothetical protein
MNKTMAMHQANYIPWIGYFYKMAHCDVFVYLDVVQYPRGKSFSARNRIKTPNGAQFLTIPVTKNSGNHGKVLYPDVQFADTKWQDKHKRALELNYKKAPYYQEVFTMYCRELDRSTSLLDLNINLIEAIAKYLRISTQRIKLSDVLSSFGQKTDLIIDICKTLDADIYLSGTGGGKEYNDEEKLSAHGIKLVYNEFHHPIYPQLWGRFIPNLSILDLLFNCGREGSQWLKE